MLALTFDLGGQHLWFSAYAGKPTLARIGLTAKAKAEERTLPAMKDDAVAYIAQNPVQRDEVAIATFQRNVFVSTDDGRTWRQIAKEGSGVH